MPVQRFLGSAWATVHGPSDPRRLWLSVLEAKFAGLAVSPGPRATDWAALHAAAADLPVRVAAVRVGNPLAEHSPTAGLCSAKDGERRAARAAIESAVATAHRLQCAIVVFDPGVVPVVGEVEAEDLGDPNVAWTRERVDALQARRKVGRNAALDRACREVFALVRSFPDIEFCLTASRSLRALVDPAALRDLTEDLGSLRLGYWHDAGLCARRSQVGLEDQGEWLEAFGNRCRGMTLGDGSSDGIYLPPGAGGVDYGLLATYVPRLGPALPAVVELDVGIAAAELPGVRSCLDKYGL
jgi:sugar phosphate isomerase/epimerase